MSKELLQDIINNFTPDKFSVFFRDKNRNFFRKTENLSIYNDDKFTDCRKLGEINFESDKVIFVCFKTEDELTERFSKKSQYEKAKKVLKDLYYDAGIFVFYDREGSFRFSLVYTNYTGTKRLYSNFRRFTYYVNKSLTNKTFLKQIGDEDFSTLDKIKEAFSVEKVTKEFYKDIANWYFWAVDNSRFPKQAEEIDNGKNIAVIRLITRLIFIWFMKELKLIPPNIFDKNFISDKILKDVSPDESTFYKAILQNLFFATLSTPKEQRRFADSERYNKGYNKDFENQSVFRFQELYKNPEDIKSYFNDIPFLNGGLFECLDKGSENYYVDGFTRRAQFQPHLPNYLFFSNEQKVDLNKWYGSKNKKYTVKGLLEILSSYNFTVDENTSDDADIALDPELLGKVFENLLASFNPETSTTARKSTGSFYTPREIVDYMVTISLKEYFKTNLEDINDLETKLEKLFNPTDEDNPFKDNIQVTKKFVNLIENVRIVDPAVGSGAFPMGILNKLVFILKKVDYENILWKEAQLKSVESIQDSRLREETKNHINNYFKDKNPDYGRKLFLIQRCIYGVDIQQIAVEIAKLRFFISLLVDEKIDKTKENSGIEPLPNLDFKIMQGNSLLEEYEGIKLFNESLFKGKDTDKADREKPINILKRNQKSIQNEILDLVKSKKYSGSTKKDYEKKLENIFKKIELVSLGKKTPEKIFDIFDTYSETNKKRDDLNKLHREFFEASKKEDKEKIRKEIEKLEWELIESTLISQNKTSKLDELNKLRKSNSKPFFLWKLHFAEVFQEKGGFDIVIGNPPYVKEYTNRKAFDGLRNSPYYQGKMDLWYLFVCKNLDYLKKKTGILCFIATNNWTTNSGASKMREKILNDSTIRLLLDFGSYMIFESADIQTMVMLLRNDKTNDDYNFELRRLVGDNISFEDVLDLISKKQTEKTEYLFPVISKENLKDKSLTFSNDVFETILNRIKNRRNFQLNENTEIAQGIVLPQDLLNKTNQKVLGDKFKVGQGIFVLSDDEKNNLNFNKKELELIKPYYTTKQINKWYGDSKNDEWIIYTDSNFKYAENIKPYPNIKKHLDKFQNVITSDNKPYGLHRAREEYFFKDEKIIVLRKCANEPVFTYTDFDCYVSATFYVIKSKRIDLKYLTAIFNSKLIAFWLRNKGKMQGNNYQLDKEPLLQIPVINIKKVKPLTSLVDRILAAKKDYPQADITKWERKINEMVYKLYDITYEEVKIIDPDFWLSEDEYKKIII